MSWRIEEADLQAIVHTDSDLSLVPFIETANALADYVSSKDSKSQLSATLLKQIELYLAAHFYSHRDQPYASKSTMGASASFQGQWGKGLESTRWGQTAMMLDVSGTLAAIAMGGGIATVEWLGKPPSEQIDYIDRD